MNHNNQLREVLMNKYDINSILHIFHDAKGNMGMAKHMQQLQNCIIGITSMKVLEIILNHATNVRDWVL